MSLAGKTVGSTAWSTGGLVVGQVVNLARLAVLARLLTPEDFGLYAMVMVFYAFLMNVGDLGCSSILVQRRELGRPLLGTVFWLNMAFGLLLSVVVWSLAPLAGSLYDEPRLTGLLRWMSILFTLSALGYVHAALLRRDHDFRTLALSNLFANVISSVGAIWLAVKGFGPLAFGFQVVSHAFFYTLCVTWRSAWLPAFAFSMDELRSIFRFSAGLTAFNFVDYVAENADKFLVGKLLGSSALGAYYLGFRLILQPMRQVSAAVKNAVFSTLARVQDEPEQLRALFLRVTYLMVAVAAPAVLLVSVTAAALVPMLFGERWSAAATVLSALAPAGVIQLIVSPSGMLCLLRSRSDILLKLSVLSLIVIPACIAIGIQFGALGAAIGYTVSSILLLWPSLRATLPLIDLSVSDFLKPLVPPLLGAACAAAVAAAVMRWWGVSGHESGPLALAGVLLLGSLAYVLVAGRPTWRALRPITAIAAS